MHVENLSAGSDQSPQQGSYDAIETPATFGPAFNPDLEKKFVPNLSLCGCDSIFTL